MGRSFLLTPTPKATMTAAEKAAQKAAEEATKAQQGYAEPEEDLSDAEFKKLQRRLMITQLQTAEMQQDIARRDADKYKADQRSTEQRRDDAQNAINAQIGVRNAAKNKCRHRQGGFGIEQTLRGDGKTSLIQVFLPVPGHRLIVCCRCQGEWRNPQPSLRQSDPKKYAEELEEFNELWEQAGDGNNQAIDVPRFAIERDGLPVQVDLK